MTICRTGALALLILTLTLSCRQQKDDEYGCTEYIRKAGLTLDAEGRPVSQQGMAISGDFIFCFEDGGHCHVYRDERLGGTAKRRRQKDELMELQPVGGFDLECSAPDQHANCVNFGIETAPGGDFPLLYITNGKRGGEFEFVCFVESISNSAEGDFASRIEQKVCADTSGFTAAGLVPFFGCPSWEIDRERGHVWIFSALKRTIPSVTGDFSNNKYIATKYRIPALSEGPEVRLTADDVLGQVVFDFDTYFTQGGCASDGKIYFCFGLSDDDKYGNCPQRIRVYDTDTGEIAARIELKGIVPQEPEDLYIAGGHLYLNTNPDTIYRIPLTR